MDIASFRRASHFLGDLFGDFALQAGIGPVAEGHGADKFGEAVAAFFLPAQSDSRGNVGAFAGHAVHDMFAEGVDAAAVGDGVAQVVGAEILGVLLAERLQGVTTEDFQLWRFGLKRFHGDFSRTMILGGFRICGIPRRQPSGRSQPWGPPVQGRWRPRRDTSV